jgi:Uma2 family endonuclease
MRNIPDKTIEHFTYADYCSRTDQIRREIIDGQVYEMTPAPSRSHQDVLRELIIRIGLFLKGKPCKVYPSPFDVRLLDNPDQEDNQISTIVQPDLTVVCDNSKLDDKGCRGAPELTIEITSPESLSRDLKTKLALYQKHGVTEYWIVNPGEKTISVFNRNKNGQFGKPIVYSSNDKIRSVVLDGIDITAGEIFE